MREVIAEDIVNHFPLPLQGIIKEIFTDGKIGISSQTMKLHLANTKVIENSPKYNTNFVLEIPYASKQLYWEIIFNDEDDTFAPDFEFTNDLFLSDPEPNIISACIPTLAKWNIKDPKSLVNVIRELLILYKKRQVLTLQERDTFSRLYDEYNMMLKKLDISSENIEIYIERTGSVHFLINITVNFTNLPPYIQPVLLGNNYNLLSPCEDTAALRISFTKSDGSRFTTDLQLSPRLEQVIGSASSLHLPKLTKDKGLVAFVSEVSKSLNEKVESVCNHFTLRKEYLQVLLSRCAQNIVEYDNKLFTYASLLCEVNTLPILITINICKTFPQGKPKVELRSVFQMHNRKPITALTENYPYSPRWKPQEMIDRLLSYLNEDVDKFLGSCSNFIDKDKK